MTTGYTHLFFFSYYMFLFAHIIPISGALSFFQYQDSSLPKRNRRTKLIWTKERDILVVGLRPQQWSAKCAGCPLVSKTPIRLCLSVAAAGARGRTPSCWGCIAANTTAHLGERRRRTKYKGIGLRRHGSFGTERVQHSAMLLLKY